LGAAYRWWPMAVTQRWPLLRRLPAYAIGIGARPAHIHSPEARD